MLAQRIRLRAYRFHFFTRAFVLYMRGVPSIGVFCQVHIWLSRAVRAESLTWKTKTKTPEQPAVSV